MDTVKVKYIGLNPIQKDTIAGTGLVWTRGQVHTVEATKAGLLMAHPMVWEIVNNDGIDQEALIQRAADKKVELMEVCRKLDIPCNSKMSVAVIEKNIAEKMATMEKEDIAKALGNSNAEVIPPVDDPPVDEPPEQPAETKTAGKGRRKKSENPTGSDDAEAPAGDANEGGDGTEAPDDGVENPE